MQTYFWSWKIYAIQDMDTHGGLKDLSLRKHAILLSILVKYRGVVLLVDKVNCHYLLV